MSFSSFLFYNFFCSITFYLFFYYILLVNAFYLQSYAVEYYSFSFTNILVIIKTSTRRPLWRCSRWRGDHSWEERQWKEKTQGLVLKRRRLFCGIIHKMLRICFIKDMSRERKDMNYCSKERKRNKNTNKNKNWNLFLLTFAIAGFLFPFVPFLIE